ncbi:uncharacterized protein N7477_009324 [Penicillium maclennaniae]|uniref:uncharacterized protein n=1 Tax=Penicillium maclennaniae TaxID=1343394 RepID=UPI002540D1D1|nr:uncharacterized protein N7477_009324 [Penicillium maclennaniae]KAJ5661708.1 hypothetical protein N7477_009324 [Penicillium maclennaniae]
MEIQQEIAAIRPLRGEVIPIRTVQETRPPEEFADAFAAEVNVKAASKVVKALDAAFPRDSNLSLGHLRRFVKQDMLPGPLKAAIEKDGSFSKNPSKTIFVLISPPVPDLDKVQEVLAPFAPLSSPPARKSPSVRNSPPGMSPEPGLPKIKLIPTRVPTVPPFNITQAERWTNNLWPVVFNAAAPRSTIAPPPQILSQAHEHISKQAGYYIALARKIGEEAEQSGRGRGVGAVIVDPAIEHHIDAISWGLDWNPRDRWMEAVIAVAGDARYARGEAGAPSLAEVHSGVAPNPASTTFNPDWEGGPDLHALMRATELVARRRREDAVHQADMANHTPPAIIATDPQLSSQLSPLESFFLYDAETPSSYPPDYPLDDLPVDPPSSPKKRKHEEPNPESRSTLAEVEVNSPSSTTSTPFAPLPAPPPSSTSRAEPIAAECSTSDCVDPFTGCIAPSRRILSRAQGGYLCTDLDVYLSHEPCLCCSMGILLSRFRAVIFPRSGRMVSGGLCSEAAGPPADGDGDGSAEHKDDDHQATRDATADFQGSTDQAAVTNVAPADDRLYYGLHWRKELNWRALGFEFVEETDGVDGSNGVAFHA